MRIRAIVFCLVVIAFAASTVQVTASDLDSVVSLQRNLTFSVIATGGSGGGGQEKGLFEKKVKRSP